MNLSKIKRILITISIFLLIPACEIKDERVTTPDYKDAAQEIELGQKVTGDLTRKIQTTLKQAVDAGGYVNTITICSQWAPVYTQQIVDKYEDVRSIKRTAFKVRNPADAPDKYEKEALLYYLDMFNSDAEIPEYFVQRIIRKDDVFFRYYAPIVMGGICLHCHGAKGNIDNEVLNKIDQLYPEDAATEYHDEEFRGVISVTMDVPSEN